MSQAVIKIAKSLQLTKEEASSVNRYENNPEGRSFLGVAEVLRKHQLHAEAIELLLSGLDLHPEFGLARVLLARAMFERGMLSNAWQQISHESVEFGQNYQANILYIRLAILHEQPLLAETRYLNLSQELSLQGDIKNLMDQLSLSGLEATKSSLLEFFKKRKIKTNLMKNPSLVQPVVAKNPPAVGKSSTMDYTFAQGFYRVKLAEVFNPYEKVSLSKAGGLMKLDSVTMANIYEKQGHFRKAVDIYGRLLKEYPGDVMLKQKLKQAKQQALEAHGEPVEFDEDVADQLESLELVDHQMDFYRDLLTRFEQNNP